MLLAAPLAKLARCRRDHRARQTWHIFTRRHAVQARCESPQGAIEFRREDFAGDPRVR